jgi:hypothetical protein
MDEAERDEVHDTVPEPGAQARKASAAKRRGTFSRTQDGLEKRRTYSSGEAERELSEDGELPLALQRVRSRRVEEMNLRLEKSRSSGSDNVKDGKRPDKTD